MEMFCGYRINFYKRVTFEKNALNLENIDPEREKRIKDKIVNGLKISE